MTRKQKRELFKEMGGARREEKKGRIAEKGRKKNKITWHGT